MVSIYDDDDNYDNDVDDENDDYDDNDYDVFSSFLRIWNTIDTRGMGGGINYDGNDDADDDDDDNNDDDAKSRQVYPSLATFSQV